MESSSPPQKTWKQWLLLLLQSMSLIGALTAAILAIEPLLTGHPNWGLVLFTFAIVLIFTALHSVTSLVSDPALRVALNAVLAELQQILQQMSALSSRLAAIESRVGLRGLSTETASMQSIPRPDEEQPYGRRG